MNKRQKKNVSVNDSQQITRSTSFSKNGNENSPIPIDVIITILLKLPLKSIARCRCVSKLWASILRRSDFTELFLTRSSSAGPKLLFAFRNQSELCIFSSPQLQSSSHVISNYQTKFSFNCKFEEIEHVYGLICVKDLRIGKKEIVLKICNPSTGQVLILPKVKTRRYKVWSVFGYDPIGNQFKVLAMTKGVKLGGMCDEYQVLTLGSGNMSWKMIDCRPHSPPSKSICINGVIYYTSEDQTHVIVCFDVRFEKFSFIKTPETINRSVPYTNLINVNGKLGLLLCEESDNFFSFDGRSRTFKLLILEDLENQVWSDSTFELPSVPLASALENLVGKFIVNFVGVTQTNEIVFSFVAHPYFYYIFYMNIENKTSGSVRIKGTEAPERDRFYTFLDHVEDVKLYANV